MAARDIASLGALGDPSGRLRRIGAPDELIAWTSGRAIDELWEECDRGDWLIWLAAVEGLPLAICVHAAASAVERATAETARGQKRLRAALGAARALRSPERCNRLAEACEARADNPEAANYRTAPPNADRWAHAAAGFTARAAEGLLRAEARRAALLDHEGRERAAAIGAGDQIVSRGPVEPLVFDPDDEQTLYCVDAATSAVRAAVRALVPAHHDDRMVEEVEGELSESVFAVLDPVRRELLAGGSGAGLIPVVKLAAERDPAKDEEPIAVPKRATVAVAAALVMPIGGGHYYAEHRVMAVVLTIGIVGGVVLSFGWSSMIVASALLVAADAALAPAAVRRSNRGAALSPGRQSALGLALVALAWVLALLRAGVG